MAYKTPKLFFHIELTMVASNTYKQSEFQDCICVHLFLVDNCSLKMCGPTYFSFIVVLRFGLLHPLSRSI